MRNMTCKNVKISELPDGYFREQLTKLVYPVSPVAVDVNVVAVEGEVSDFAVYCGWPAAEYLNGSSGAWDAENIREPGDVARNGGKFPEKEARILFPELSELRYRP